MFRTSLHWLLVHSSEDPSSVGYSLSIRGTDSDNRVETLSINTIPANDTSVFSVHATCTL